MALSSSWTSHPLERLCNLYPQNQTCVCHTDDDNNDKYKYNLQNSSGGGTYCCDRPISFPIIDANTPLDYIKNYVTDDDINDPCTPFFQDTAKLTDTDDDFKKNYNRLYTVTNVFQKLSKEFPKAPTVSTDDGKTLTCSEEGYVPYIIDYHDGIDDDFGERIICHKGGESKSDWNEISGVEYSAYHVLNSEGKPCTSQKCTTKYDATTAWNKGSQVFGTKTESNKTTNKHPVEKWYLWAGIAGAVFLVLIGLIIVYRHGHHKEVNALKSQLPPTEIAKAQRKINAHEFANIH